MHLCQKPVINFSNILLYAANHSMAENEADNFIVPDVQHFFQAYFFFFFFFFFRTPVCRKRTKKGRDLSASPITIPLSKN